MRVSWAVLAESMMCSPLPKHELSSSAVMLLLLTVALVVMRIALMVRVMGLPR